MTSKESAATVTDAGHGYRRGDGGYTRITAALFAAGMATFISMYAAQAVLPDLAREFGASPARASLAVSVTTGVLAFAIVPASILSERFGRTRVMVASALASAVIGLLVPMCHSLELLLVGRALQGLTLAGVPAVAMAYLAEEIDASSLGAAMGRYVAGTTLGGLAGRLLASCVLEFTSWRWALESTAVVALLFTALFVKLAPESRFFEARVIGPRVSVSQLLLHVRNPRIVALVAIAFLLMGGFVSVYNVLGFRLLKAPFSLPQTAVGLVFCIYLCGTVTSALAGRVADTFGRGPVLTVSIVAMGLGLVTTGFDSLAAVLAGTLVFTGGFFAAHSTASGWVSAIASKHRAQASSLYLFGYYTGSSVIGALAGLPFARFGWDGTLLLVLAAVLIGLVIAIGVWRRSILRPAHAPEQ